MKPLVSPYELDQVKYPEIPQTFKKVPIIGRLLWWFHRPTKWAIYFDCLKAQVEQRGQVPAEEWASNEMYSIAREIQALLKEHCWQEYLSFHPKDPYYVIAEFEVGDLSEVSAIMAIEEVFGVKFDDTYFTNAITFEDVVRYVDKHKTKELGC